MPNESPTTYTLTAGGLTITDLEAFGLDGRDLYDQPDFSVASCDFSHNRRTYTVFELVLRHAESGRCFATAYSTHEDTGWEYGPGMDRDAPRWTEVYPKEVTTTTYSRTK